MAEDSVQKAGLSGVSGQVLQTGMLFKNIAQQQQQQYMQMSAFGNGYLNYSMMDSFSSDIFSTIRGWDDCSIQRTNVNNMLVNIMSGKTSGNSYSGINPQVAAEAALTTNNADYFKKLTNEKGDASTNLQRLQQIEKDIKAKEEAAKKEKDETKKNEINGQVEKLKNEYRKLERTISSTRSSKNLGEEFNFYSNLDKKELEQISEKNKDIDADKAELEAKKQESIEKRKTILQKLQAIGIPCAIDTSTTITGDFISRIKAWMKQNNKDPNLLDTAINADNVNEILAIDSETKALQSQIADKIKKLETNIKAAGKDNKTTYFNTNTVEKAEKAKEKAVTAKKEAEEVKKANAIKTLMAAAFDKDGNVKANATAEMEKVAKTLDSKYGEAEIKEAVDFLGKYMKDGASLEKVQAAVNCNEFFDDLAEASFTHPSPKVNTQTGSTLAILERLYDQIGAVGNFKAYLSQAMAVKRSKASRLPNIVAKNDMTNTYSMNATWDSLKNVTTAKNTPTDIQLINQAKASTAELTKHLNDAQHTAPEKDVIEDIRNRLEDRKGILIKYVPTEYNELIAALNKLSTSTSGETNTAEEGGAQAQTPPVSSSAQTPAAKTPPEVQYAKQLKNKLQYANPIDASKKFLSATKDNNGATALEAMNDADFIAMFLDDKKAIDYAGKCYAWNDDVNAISKIVTKFNEIAKRLNMPDRIVINSGRLEYQKRANTNLISEDVQAIYKASSSSNWTSNNDNYLHGCANAMAVAIKNKLYPSAK